MPVRPHQAALIDVISGGKLLDLHSRHAVLIDEADQLPDAAALRLENRISAKVLEILGVEVKGSGPIELARVVKAVRKSLSKNDDRLDEPADVLAACAAIERALEEPAWYKLVHEEDDGGICLQHLLPARAMSGLLKHPRLTFVSATLSVGGSFKDFANALGLKDGLRGSGEDASIGPAVSALSTQIEPEFHGSLRVVSSDWDRERPDHFEKVAQHVGQLRGSVLVITTSYEHSSQLGQLLETAIVRQRGETAGEAVLRMGDRSILIAAGAWAGLDTPRQWDHVVMPCAPYKRPEFQGADELAQRFSYLNSRNAATRRFRQGLARGLRTPEAICDLYLLDGRFKRDEFVNAMPQRFNAAISPWVDVQVYVQALSGSIQPGQGAADAASELRDGEAVEDPQEGVRSTESEATVKVRTAQGVFRNALLVDANRCCMLTGMNYEPLLMGSHIKPWAESSDAERIDVENGLLLRVDVDKLFDRGLISFDDEGRLIVARTLPLGVLQEFGLEAGLCLPRKVLTPRRRAYLAVHREMHKEGEFKGSPS